jgi:murein DD-endopeptidase MepM/ murein hydrolase activator NlpD
LFHREHACKSIKKKIILLEAKKTSDSMTYFFQQSHKGLLLFFAFSILFVHTNHSSAQDPLTGIDVEIIDTVLLNGQKILLYDNNTWEFLADLEALKRDQEMADTMSIFTLWWDNEQTFVYSYPIKAVIPDTVTVILTSEERKFVLPYYNRINSGFGWRGRTPHNGIDVHLDKGEPIKAAFDGKVRYAKFNTGGYGKLVIIRHFNGLETYYAHLNHIYVQPNQIVKAGQIIGTGGNTGATWTGDHLHFEMRYLDKPFDPILAIEYDSLRLKSDTLVLTASSFKMTTNHKGVKTGGSSSTQNYTYDPNATYHSVRKGDTLGHIAIKYGTTVDRLCKLNNLSRTSVLQIGQKIKVR